jgi:multiple sugar transport system ATP-binding protein
MNLVRGTLNEKGDSWLFSEMPGGTIEVPLSIQEWPAARPFVGKSMLLGIRPEDIQLADSARNDGSVASFSGTVEIAEQMGAETNLYLQTGAHTVVCRSQRALDLPEPGQRLQFEMNSGKAHLFDPATGRRVN